MGGLQGTERQAGHLQYLSLWRETVREYLVSGEAVTLDPISDRSRPGLLSSLRAHALMIAVLTVVCGAVGYLASPLLPTSYTAESSVFLAVDQPFDAAGERSGNAERFTADQVEIVVTTEVLENAATLLIPTLPLDEIQASVSAVGSVVTNRLTVVAERPDPEQARALADAVVAAYRELSARRVVAILSAAQAEIDDPYLEGQMRVRAAVYGDGVGAVEPAALPTEPSAPLPVQNALIAGVVGLLIGTGLAVLRDQRRARTASVADLDLLIGAPLITRYIAPASSASEEMVVLDPAPEQLRSTHDVLAAIDVALEDERDRTVLFLSWQRSLTTTSLVVSAGLASARAGRDVVLIDGGLKERGISALTDVDPGLGLDALADPTKPLKAALRSWRLGDADVQVVPLDGWAPSHTGAAARPQVLRAATMRLQEDAALVLVDGPPLTERSLGLALGRGVNGVVLVIDEETSVDDAHEMGRRIALAGVRVLGYVLVAPARQLGVRRMTWTPRRRNEGPVSLGVTAAGVHRA